MAFESNITATNTSGSDATKIDWTYGSAPGLDPEGIVAEWIATADPLMRQAASEEPIYTRQREYDGSYCYLDYTAHIDEPALEADLIAAGKGLIDATVAQYPPLAAGPTDDPTPIMQAFWRYNWGPYRYAADPRVDPGDVDTYKQYACNWARGSSLPFYILHNDTYSTGEWPLSGTYSDPPTDPPDAAVRDKALDLICHVVTDDWYSTYEQRPYQGNTYLWGHQETPGRLMEWWYFYPGGCVDQWIDIAAELQSVNGDWSLVPRSWRNGIYTNGDPVGDGYSYSPFMMVHALRAWMVYYEDGWVWQNDIRPQIIDAAIKICDIMIRDFRAPVENSSNYALIYQVPGPGTNVPVYADKDIAGWLAPAFAWVYSKTGDDKYYDMAVNLYNTANQDGYWVLTKQSNQNMIWAYQGFQWLGWAATPWSVWWRGN